MLNGGVVSQESLMGAPATVGLATPTTSDIAAMTLAYSLDLREDFRERDDVFRKIDDVIYLRNKVNIPMNFEKTAIEVRSPHPMHITNQITSALSINTPRVVFDPIEFGDSGEDAAAYRSRFFMASWNRQQREKNRQLFRAFMHSDVTKGIAIFKTYERKNRAWAKYYSYSRDTLDELEKKYQAGMIDQDSKRRIYDRSTEQFKRGMPYPIETTDIPPETFYYQMGEDGFTRCVEIKQVPFYDTLKKFGVAFDPRGKCCWDDVVGLALPDTEWHKFYSGSLNRRTIEMVEMWDVDYCTIVLRGPGDFPSSNTKSEGSGLVVKRYPHSYGDQVLRTLRGPYFMASGITTSSRRPHEANLSVIFAYMHLFPILNALLTMQGQSAFTFSFPAYKRTQPPAFGLPNTPFGVDAVDATSNREKIVPGAIFPHDVAPMDPPRAGIDLDKAITIIRDMIDMALPDSMKGVISGETAGYALNQAAHLASLAWDPIKRNVEDAMSARTAWESMLISNFIGEPVYVYGSIPQPRIATGAPRTYKNGWMGLGPKDIKDAHNYSVLLEPASVNTDTLILRNMREKLDMRLIDPYSAIREIGGNPLEVERAWTLYELKQDDEIKKAMKQRIFQSIGTLDQESLRQVGPEGQPGGQPPVPVSGQPAGAQPGISQGLPATGYVPPAGAVPNAQPAPQPAPVVAPPMSQPRPPGTPAGAPGGVPGAPANAVPVPGV